MFNINNLIQPATSIYSLSSNTSSSTPLYHPHPTRQNQTSPEFHIPSFSSPLCNPPLPAQQQYHYSYPHQSHSQTLSQDEWALIVSLRMMNNLSVLPPFQPPPTSAIHQQSGDVTSHQPSSSDQTGHQIQLSTYYATKAASIHPYTPPPTAPLPPTTPPPTTPPTTPTTTPQQLLHAQQIQCPTTQTQQLLATATPQLSTVSAHTEPGQISSTSRIPSSQQLFSPSQIPASQQMSSPSQIQSGHQNHSTMLQLQSHASPSASPPPAIISPVQQHQRKPSDKSILASPQQYQLAHPQTPTIFHYNPTITGPIVQLLDPTKSYQLGDTIKIGGRTLESDVLSMKYWCEDDITVSETTTGGYMLNMAGYSYFVKNYGKNFTTWECEYRRKRRCSSVVIRSSDPTVNNYFRIYSIQGEHIHEPAPNNVEVRKFKHHIRERCRQELSSPRTIYEDELKKGKYSSEMLAVLPTFYNMQAQLYRIRQEHLPPSPTDPNFILHPAFTSTDQGERFLLYDSNNVQAPYASAPTEVGCLIIYASDLQLNILSKSKRIGSDGTFETAPQITHQNYIIMGEYEEKHVVPLVFCLCERMNYRTYELIIQVLKTAVGNLKADFKPMYWMSDYEAALTKAIKKELPNTELLGCAFHYNQAIYRNIQTNGLQEAYQNIETVRQMLRQIMALAFMPRSQIKIVYNDVIKPQLSDVPTRPTSLRHNLRNFLKYYESYWLTKIYKFCVFDQPTRTNNGLEGYNNKMKVQLTAHPHLYRLITWFEKEELLVQQLVMKMISDVPVHKRKRAPVTVLIDHSLQALWDSYKSGTLTPKALLLQSSKWIARKA